jgi:hypothetical protein
MMQLMVRHLEKVLGEVILCSIGELQMHPERPNHTKPTSASDTDLVAADKVPVPGSAKKGSPPQLNR